MKKPHDYKAEARKLRRYGVEFSFDLRRTLSPQAKAAISRKRHRLAGYVNPENNFKFIPLKTKVQRSGVRRTVSRDQVTPGGVFVQVPKLKRGRARVRVTKKGELIISGGKRVSKFVRIKGDIIRADSVEELRKRVYRATKGRKVSGVRLHVRGYGAKAEYISLKQFFDYYKDLSAEIEEAEEADEETDLDDLFSVEIITTRKNERSTKVQKVPKGNAPPLRPAKKRRA